jgi:hypothetical protein
MKLYAPEGYSGELMCLEEAVESAEWSGCRVICVYRKPVLADINVDELTRYVIDWIDDHLKDDDALRWDDGWPLLGVANGHRIETVEEIEAVERLSGAIQALLEASLDLSEAAWQHERDIWLPEWPGGCDRLWGARCDTGPAGPWGPARRRAARTCVRERHGNPVRPMPQCEVPA